MSYEGMAEFHDLFMTAAWERVAPAIAAALAGLNPDDVLIDLGAGTGLGTMSAVEHTAARVWALEPTQTMRAVLLHRVAACPEASSRVSVVAGAVPADLGALPSPVAGVIATHVLGHLTPDDRAQVWAWLADHLTPEGVAVVTYQAAHATTADQPDRVVEEARIGEHIYRVTYQSSGVEFSSRYEVVDAAGTVLRTTEALGSWVQVTLADLRTETAAAGLSCRDSGADGVCLIRR